MQKCKVKVVVPVYKERLEGRELLSLKNNAEKLARYPHIILAPEGLNVDAVVAEVPGAEVVRVSGEWLGKNGVAGYNRMMLSKSFYELFIDTDYILICQSDAWVFCDRLDEWCDRGYDYIGAPWPKRRVYNLPIVRQWLWLRRKLFGSERILRQDYFKRVGNGGFSLRRIDSFIAACDRYANRIEEFKQGKGIVYNEDWFWALVPREFLYPSFDEALGFSFDSHPELCFRLAEGVLPFGCHGWYKRRNIEFWSPIIER